MLRRNGPVVKSVESVLRLEGSLWGERFVEEVGVRSTIRRRRPPQRAVLSQVDCFVQCEVVVSQVSLDGVQPRGTGTP